MVAVINNCDIKLFQWSNVYEIKEFKFECIKAHIDIFRRSYILITATRNNIEFEFQQENNPRNV
jgi:hypothetical protein